jgi:hypothetical protein
MYEHQLKYYQRNKDALRIKARIAYHAKKRKGTFFSVRHSEHGFYPFSKDITNGNMGNSN